MKRDLVEPVLEVVDAAGREVVEHPNLMALVAEGIDQMGAEVAGSAGDEDAHSRSSYRSSPEVSGAGAVG